jgi:phenylacetate-CoA ligase
MSKTITAAGRRFNSVLESMSRSDLAALQEAKLRKQVERAYATTPFYKELFDAAGVRPEQIRSLADVRRLPVIGKDDIIQNQIDNPIYGTFLGIREDQVWEIAQSSGTSGKGQELHAFTLRDAHMRGALNATGWAWAGNTRRDAMNFHIGATNSASFGCMSRGIRATGRMPYLIGHVGFEERIELMLKFGMEGMYGMPSALNGVTLRLQERGIEARKQWPNLKAIMTSAESWPVEWVERMEGFWGARVYEEYGSTQTHGTYGMSCCELGAVVDGRRGRNHFFEWSFLFEVVNPDTLEPVAPGEEGELIVTHLDKEASPLLRFRTRDRMRWFPHDDCSCGLPLDCVEAGTIGRWDDMLKVKGQNIWPPTIDAMVLAYDFVDEYQARIYIDERGRDQIELRYGLKQGPPDQSAFEREVVERLKHEINITVRIREVAMAELPHYNTSDFKPRRWKDERHAGLAAPPKPAPGSGSH